MNTLTALVSLAMLVGDAWGQADFRELGALPGCSCTYSVAYAVSGDGSTVTGIAASPLGQYRAFRWTADDGMVDLGLPPGTPLGNHEGRAISQDGRFIVGYMDRTEIDDSDGFFWSTGNAPVLLTDNGGMSVAYGVTDDGSVVAGWYWPNGAPQPRASLWRAQTGWTPIGPLGSEAYAITPDGSAAVGQVGGRAFRWTQAGGFMQLPSPGVAWAFAVTPDGAIVVGYAGQAFRWTAQTGTVLLGDLPGGPSQSGAAAIAADASRIVGYGTTAAAGNEAFVYSSATGMRNLRDVLAKQHGLTSALPNGRKLEIARGISGDGTVIVGSSTDLQDLGGQAFVAHLPRCPGDYNRDGHVSPADVTAFVTAWFQSLMDGNDWGDFDLDGVVTPADVAGFVKAWWVLVTTGGCG